MSENNEETPVPDSAPSNESAADGKFTLIVNYLPQSSVDKDLYFLFAPFGNVQSVRIVRNNATGYSFGYGFVTYKDTASCNKAIAALNGTKLMDKTIKVSFARPPGDALKDTNLYITNLPKDYSESDLELLFGPYGTIVQKKVLKDKITSMPKGVAFVRYEKKVEAQEALKQLNGHMPEGATQPINIKVAENHSQEKAAYYAGLQQGIHFRRGRGRGFGPPSRGHLPRFPAYGPPNAYPNFY